jgi:glutamate--cysteine ligase catalytic subunit
VDENMQRAQRRGAVRTGRFFFRKDVLPPGGSPSSGASRAPSECGSASGPGTGSGASSPGRKERALRNCYPPPPEPAPGTAPRAASVADEYAEMSVDEIVNGGGADGFTGLLGLVRAYLDTLDVAPAERAQIDRYLDLVRRRADGARRARVGWRRALTARRGQAR